MFCAERIKNLEKKKTYRKKNLAKLLQLGQSTMLEYENGIEQPPISVLIQLADFFNVNIDYLLGCTNIRISMERLKQQLTTNSGSITIDDFIRLKDDEKEAIGNLILSFKK